MRDTIQHQLVHKNDRSIEVLQYWGEHNRHNKAYYHIFFYCVNIPPVEYIKEIKGFRTQRAQNTSLLQMLAQTIYIFPPTQFAF